MLRADLVSACLAGWLVQRSAGAVRFGRMSGPTRYFLREEVHGWLASPVSSKNAPHMQNTMCTWPRLGSGDGQLAVGEAQL